MSENYEFPDAADVPKIKATGEQQFEKKNLFIKYDADDWDDPEDAIEVINTINYLFGTDVQVTVMDDKIEFMTQEQTVEVVEKLIEALPNDE